jgi:hypothetical protein
MASENRPPGPDHVQLRIIVAVPFVSGKIVGQRGVQRGGLPDALGPAEARQHSALVRRNGEETQHQRSKQDIGDKAQANAREDFNACHFWRIAASYF